MVLVFYKLRSAIERRVLKLGGNSAQRGEGLSHHPHGFERWIEAMVIEPLQVSPGPPAVLGRRRMFAPNTDRIPTPEGLGEGRFETDVTCPIRTKIVDVPKPLTAMEPQGAEPHLVGIGTAAARLSAMNVETVEMLITPGKHHLEDRVELCKGGLTMDQEATPDQWTDAA
jgi:hypothetical protein